MKVILAAVAVLVISIFFVGVDIFQYSEMYPLHCMERTEVVHKYPSGEVVGKKEYIYCDGQDRKEVITKLKTK